MFIVSMFNDQCSMFNGTAPLIEESHQILKTLTKIIKNAESNPGRGTQDSEH